MGNINNQEKSIQEFLRDGYIISSVENRENLDRIRDFLVLFTAKKLDISVSTNKQLFLDSIHNHVRVEELNKIRVAAINALNDTPWARDAYYSLAKNMLDIIVGNELVMQKRLNLSIQLPHDSSSTLPLHVDVWNGDSPYEVVLWLPYVNTYKTKSMYIVPRYSNEETLKIFEENSHESEASFLQKIKNRLIWLSVDYGQFLLFSQNMMHGNIINKEAETRWSSNCRFKSIFSPYRDKKLGEFFEPISLKPATQLGLKFYFPEVKNEARF